MKYSEQNPPLQCFMRQSTCYNGTRIMNVKGVLWHSTGANNPYLKRYVQPDDNASDKAEWLSKLGVNANRNDWNHVQRQAGLNCWIGKLQDWTVTTVQTMPWNFRPWGCGSGSAGSCNTGWIQFEICEDNLSDAAYFNAVYEEACQITAYLCKMYGIDPMGSVKVGSIYVPTILCHWDSYELKMGSGHSDVYHWFKKYNRTMEDVRTYVKSLVNMMEPCLIFEDVEYRAVVNSPDGFLNVRSWPTMSDRIVGKLLTGDVVEVTQEYGGWCNVGTGWVYGKYLTKYEEEVDMSKDELIVLIQDTVKKAVEQALEEKVPEIVDAAIQAAFPVYEKLEDVPEFYYDTIHKLMNRNALRGTGEPGIISVPDVMCRCLVILDRLVKLD